MAKHFVVKSKLTHEDTGPSLILFVLAFFTIPMMAWWIAAEYRTSGLIQAFSAGTTASILLGMLLILVAWKIVLRNKSTARANGRISIFSVGVQIECGTKRSFFPMELVKDFVAVEQIHSFKVSNHVVLRYFEEPNTVECYPVFDEIDFTYKEALRLSLELSDSIRHFTLSET